MKNINGSKNLTLISIDENDKGAIEKARKYMEEN